MTMSKENRQKSVKRDHKSRIFTMIFSQKKELLELYNAVSGKAYTDPEALTVNTLENAIYMSMQNDVSFIIDSRLYLYEHQSTYNPNIPLRLFLYLSDLYSAMIQGRNIYGSKKILIPPPHFIVFYNGVEEHEEREILKLSDLYEITEEEVDLELKVVMLNINRGNNRKLLEACKTLGDYAEYIYRIREYAKESPIEEAVERAVTECIREGILKEFLEKNRAEAIAMSIYEYNESEHMRMEREDAYADGHKAGYDSGEENGRIQMLELFRRMTAEGMSEHDIAKRLEKVTKEPALLEKMLIQYKL